MVILEEKKERYKRPLAFLGSEDGWPLRK